MTIACNNSPKQASIEGTLENLPKELTEVTLRTKDKVKNIKIENGVFKDTININNEFAYLQIGNKGKTLFLNKNAHLVVTADFADFENTISFNGDGEDENNYINNREKITFKVFGLIDSINKLDQSGLDNYISNMSSNIDKLLAKNKDINPVLLKAEKENLPLFLENIKKQYNSVNNKNVSLKLGDSAPNFTYENYKGGNTSLEDLKGNLVYIDIWATWCPPCIAEIPYLKKMEEKFHDKKIKFVSISVDNPNAKDKWKNMIKAKQMGGVQLFTGGDNSIMEAFEINGIPRFILLDKEGKIINSNAPRPSSNTTLENLIKSNL